MPLFIFLSGYITPKENFTVIDFLKKRFKQLIVPYLSWMFISSFILYIVYGAGFFETILSKIIYPDNGLWFLWVLYFMHLGYTIYRKHIITLLVVCSCLIIAVVTTKDIPNYFLYKTIPIYFFYYMLGVLFNKYFSSVLKPNSKSLRLISVIFLFVSLVIVFFSIMNKQNVLSFVYSPLIKIFVSILGILTWTLLFMSFVKFPRFLLLVGKMTLPIYILQSFGLMVINNFLRIISYESYYYLLLPVIVFLLIVFCILVFKLLSKNKYLSGFLFGNIKYNVREV